VEVVVEVGTLVVVVVVDYKQTIQHYLVYLQLNMWLEL
jgi:hypothetical protein